MDDTITATYFVCDEFSKATGLRDDPQSRMTAAEVMCVALVASASFSGNIERARPFLYEYGYMKTMLSKSRLNRRPHGIEPSLWEALFSLLAEVFKERDGAGGGSERNYVVDSLPVPVCDNIRIRRCRIYPLEERGKAFRGYIPSKRRYFYGLRVHLLASGAGEPVEFSLAAGSEADVSVFKDLSLELPEGSTIHADKGYTDHGHEDFLRDVGVRTGTQSKKNSKRPTPMWEEFLGKPVRQYIETVSSGLSRLFSGRIHAVTPRGFELEIVCFLLAFSIQCL